ncbi:unnamed protein product [Closterium sp. Yama58-4]|nr:unnamed protein product [Closterium sp. Yama58-4]
MAGPDEYFISKFFLDRGVPWTHVHMRFGAISWVVDEALQGQAPPVFIHYVSEKPWVAPAAASTAPAAPTPAAQPSSEPSSTVASSTVETTSTPAKVSTVKPSSPPGGSTVTNWSDFLVWDSIAEQVVGLLQAAGEEEASAAGRLFAGFLVTIEGKETWLLHAPVGRVDVHGEGQVSAAGEEQVVGLLQAAGEEEAGAAGRLFAGWEARRKLPVVFPEKQG